MKSSGLKPRHARERGAALWVILVAMVVLVFGAWRYNVHRSEQRLAEAKRVEQTRIDQERKATEERLAKERAQRDALTSTLKAVDNLVAKWEDATKLASTTARMSLSGPVSSLQSIKREAEQLTVPPCLDQGKVELVKSMSSTEKGYLVFMRNELRLGDVLAQADFDDAAKAMEAFRKSRAECPA